jgi:pullulanase
LNPPGEANRDPMKKALTTIILSTLIISAGCAAQVQEQKNRTAASSLDKDRSYVTNARARWISRDVITWKLPFDQDELGNYKFSLYYSPRANITVKRGVLSGGTEVAIEPTGFVAEGDPLLEKYPYLKGQLKFSLANLDKGKFIPELVRDNVIVVIKDSEDNLVDATQVQNYGVLDELYTYNKEDLGLTFSPLREPTMKIWAPTAKSVRVHIFDRADSAKPWKIRAMKEQVNEGVWTLTGDVSWINKYYLYEVEVYSPSSGLVENNLVTDPYSISLSTNSKKSQITELNDSRLKPAGWDTYKKPTLASLNDSSVYELHIRDFSINDQTVSAKNRGKYLAFTEQNSDGMNHLKQLAGSGMTHVHILPAADFASVDENQANRSEPAKLTGYSATSEVPQQKVGMVRDKDSYNWGYDPFHYSVPEGSYASDPNGSARTLEFRQMVKSLNDIGLRVIMDVVYNHTHSAGQDEDSVLDKIVPGYYYRLDDNGNVQNTTCCPDTATEHNMMEKLMIDSLKLWAKEYKVDGFRFDLMGHHTRDNLTKVKQALESLTPDRDGVDGKKFFFMVKDGNSAP